ncbi:MAG TPA: hypothetical protein VK745_25870, partial [Polyangiaceae bacterium]|nr:hypothetical protein [Polyangiaceae bacterium]
MARALKATLVAFACLGCAPCPCQVAPHQGTAASYHPPHYDHGAFSVAMQGGQAWFIAPDGQRFLSQGVNHVGD